MTPVLYAATERQFIDNGLGPLGELYSAEVVEKRNGELELTAYYPATGRHYDDIKQGRIILAKPSPRDDHHAFRIVSAELDIAGQSLEIIADSITNDLAGSLITGLDITDLNGDDAMHKIHDAMTVDVGIEMDSDIETKSSTSFKYVNPLEAVAGTTGSILQYWGGEMKRENGRLSMLKRRGYDNVTTFRLGKNIKGLTYTVDASSLVTRVYPYWHGQLSTDASTTQEETYISGTVVDSSEIGKYSHVYIKPVDASQEITVPQDTTATDIKKLVDEWAKNWFTKSENTDIDKPKVTLDITPLDLQSSTDYADIAVLETLGLTDSVTVYVPEYGVDVTAVVNELHYDPLLEQTTEIVAGTAKVSFAESNAHTLSTMQSQLAAVATQADAAAISADGKSTNYYGDQPPVGATDGDYWFYSDVNGEGIKQLQNGVWTIIVDTNLPKQLETQMVAASTATSAAVVAANSAADKASLAADSVAAVSAGVTIAQSVAEQAQSAAADAAASGVTAMSNAATALSLASGATIKATSVGASVDSLAGTIQLKADKSVVDGLSKSVSSASAELTVQAGQIAIKADSTTVNSLAGTVSSQGTQLSAQAGSLALTVSKSDLTNSLAGYATQAYTQAQVTAASDKIQSTVSAVSTKVDDIQVGGTNLLTGTGDRKVTGLNAYSYLSNETADNLLALFKGLEGQTVTVSVDYEYSGFIAGSGNNRLGWEIQLNTDGSSWLGAWYYPKNDSGSGRVSYTFVVPKNITGMDEGWGYVQFSGSGTGTVSHLKLEKGNKATDWSPAPEDLTSYTDSQVSTVTQTVTALQATVADKVSTSQLTLMSNQLTSTIEAATLDNSNQLYDTATTQTVVGNSGANQTNSGYLMSHSVMGKQVTIEYMIYSDVDGGTAYPQYTGYPGWSFNAPSVSIKKGGNYSHYTWTVPAETDSSQTLAIQWQFDGLPVGAKAYVQFAQVYYGDYRGQAWAPAPNDLAVKTQITQLQNDINLRVKTGDVISQINLDTSGVLIDGAKNHITGLTTIDSGVIKDAMIDSLSASKITAGTINASVARIINLDVSSLVGDKTSFVQSAWNSISGYVHVDANGIRIGQGAGVLLLQSDGMHILDSYNSEDVGRIHANSIDGYPQYNGLKFDLNKSGDYMGWGYRRDDTSLYTLALSYWPVKIGSLNFQKGLNLSDDMWINTDKTLYLRKIGTWNYSNADSQYFTIQPFTMSGVSYPMISAGGTAGIFIGDDSIYMRWKNGIYNMWDVIHSIGKDETWT
jgi:phage minor structural protein